MIVSSISFEGIFVHHRLVPGQVRDHSRTDHLSAHHGFEAVHSMTDRGVSTPKRLNPVLCRECCAIRFVPEEAVPLKIKS